MVVLRYGVFSMQGKRKTMEDMHWAYSADQDTNNTDGEKETTYEPSGPQGCKGFFAVYDGHGGQRAAIHAYKNLAQYALVPPDRIAKDPRGALTDAINRVDSEFLEIAAKEELADGTTATVVVVTNDGELIVANVGDSEAVVGETRGERVEAIPLSAIHNIKENPEEEKRILAAGGNIFHGRVGHPCLNPAYFSIAVSRAIGDLMFKSKAYTDGKPSGVIADPEIKSISLTPDHQVLVIACDGLWSVLKHQAVIDLAVAELQEKKASNTLNHPEALDSVAKVIAERAFREGSTDNITVMVVTITH